MLLPVVAGAILVLTYLILAIGRAPYLRIDRTGAAIVGATLMVATGVLSLDEAYRAIDYRTLVLLFGMMVLIAHLRMARFFRGTVQWVAARVHQPKALLAAIANLIVLEGARRRQVEITFWAYSKVGFPVTILTLAFGVWWLAR